MSGTIFVRDQRILYMHSYGICAIPTCRRELLELKTKLDDVSNTAQMAHIKGEKPGSARYDETMEEKMRNKHDNLILVCSTCHKIIDDQPNTYTVEKLRTIKSEHEQWASTIFKKEISNITFVELETITQYLISDNPGYKEDYQLTNPIEKIKKNKLSKPVSILISMGMTQVKLVGEYIDTNLDLGFGERLRDGFVKEYVRLKNDEKLQGDEMFYALLEFAGGKVSNVTRNPAGLAVLVYLFESCEVLEK